MPTPITSGTGGNQRRVVLGLVQIDHLYPTHRDFLQRMVQAGYSIALLENSLIEESLRFGGSEAAVRSAWQTAFIGRHRPAALTEEATAFGHALLRAARELWTRPPFDHPDTIIYGARRHGYIGMALAVEVTYRDPLHLPSHAHSSAPARA